MTGKIVLIGFALTAIALAGAIKYTYDTAGRLIGVAYPDGKVIVYTYDKAGNLLSRVVSSEPAPATATAKSASSASVATAPGEIASSSGTDLMSVAAVRIMPGWPPMVFLTPRATVNGTRAPDLD
jgi:YD repeat-containing protein